MKKLSLIILASILTLALFLRVYKLDAIPPALFGDEIDVGYQAYSLLKTGRDLSGEFMPLYIQSLSEHRTSLYLYSAVPFIGIFGLNEWGVRLPAVFWGMVSIVGLFLLVRKLLNLQTALIAAFIFAVSPWHLQYSRASFEVTMLTSFIIFGIFFFLIGLSKNRYLFISSLLLLLTFYIYSTAVVFIPLLVLLLLGIYRKEIFRIPLKTLSLLVIFSVILMLPFAFFYFAGQSQARFSAISIFQDRILEDKIHLARKAEDVYSPEGQISTQNPQIERLFHNRYAVYTQVFLTNYFKSISPLFLYADGDINFRHSIHEMGQQYYVEFILLLIGLFALAKIERKKSILIAGWFLIAPIPSALTNEGGTHATRLFIMLPALIIITALGADWLVQNSKKTYLKIILLVLAAIFVLNFVFYLHRYYSHYGSESWRWWHVGFKEAMLFIKSEEVNYKKVGFNDSYEPSLIRFLFWNQIDPAEFQKQFKNAAVKTEIFPGYTGTIISDKYFFGMSGQAEKEIIRTLPAGVLYMVSARDEVPGDWNWAQDPPQGIKVLKTIYDPTGTPIFYVIAKQ